MVTNSPTVFKLCEIKVFLCRKKMINSYDPLFRNTWRNCNNMQEYTESSKYYAQPQTAVARGLGWLASRLTGLHTAAAPKHSLYFSFQFPSNLVTRINVHLQSGDVSVYRLWLLLDISAVGVVIVIIAICDMPRQEFSLCERVYIHNTYMKSRKLC